MSKNEAMLVEAQGALGVDFNEPSLLKVALTHSSYAYEISSLEFNEKLEFLGDSALGLAITEYIYQHFPQMQEGGLAKLRANLVRAETLAAIAGELDLGRFMLIGKGAEQSGGRNNESILADCLEAVIGAIYLDRGYETTRDFIIDLFVVKIHEEGSQKELGDPKTNLQELTMEKWGTLPDYNIVNQEGPAHKPMFLATVSIRGQTFGRGEGASKKKAEQIAAKEALETIANLDQ